MIRTSSSSAAALESSFSSALPLSRLRGASSSKRGKRWFRPRLVALTLLLAAVLGVEEEQSSSSSPLSLASPTLTSSASSAFSTTGAALPPPPRFPDPPYSFAHRGSSGALPEHTMQAYALAVEQGADFIECDAVFTRDCHLLCRHDADLSRSTDAASKFSSKTRNEVIDGVVFSKGVFAADLTLSEIRSLRARQAKADSLGRTKAFDGLFPLVTLDEFAAFAARVPVDGGGGQGRWNETSSPSSPPLPPRRRVVGVHVEAKHPLWHSRTLPRCAADPAAMVDAVASVLRGHGFATPLLNSSSSSSSSSSRTNISSSKKSSFQTDPRWLRAPTFLQSFEPGALREAGRRGKVGEGVPLVQLVDEPAMAVPAGWGGASSSSPAEGNENGNLLTFADLLTDGGLKRVAEYAHAIGPSVAQVLDFPAKKKKNNTGDDGSENAAAPSFSSLVPRASARGLAVHAYTLRDDLVNLERFKKLKDGADREAEALFSGARVEGAFGDFPLTTARAARKEREEREERRRRRGERGVVSS